MFGLDLDNLLGNPTIVRMAAKASGVQAARLDVNPASGELLASLKIHGQIKQVHIPTRRTFTIDQILAMLFADQGGQKEPGRLSGPAEISAAIDTSPP